MKKLMTLISFSLLITISAVIGFGATTAPTTGTSAKESMKVFGSPPAAITKVATTSFISNIQVSSIANVTYRPGPLILADLSAVVPSAQGIAIVRFVNAAKHNGGLRTSRPYL